MPKNFYDKNNNLLGTFYTKAEIDAMGRGFDTIDLTSSSLVQDLESIYATNEKPVLVYDENDKANWFTLTKVDTDYYLTGANVKYKITSAGVITSETVGASLYEHNLKLVTTGGGNNAAITLYCTILNDKSDAITRTNLHSMLKKHKPLLASGTIITVNVSQGGYLYYEIDAIEAFAADPSIKFYLHRFNTNASTSAFEAFEHMAFDIGVVNSTITDNVVKLI